MINDLLPWLNIAIIPVLAYVMKIESRLVKMETIIKFHRLYEDSEK